ncbi:MAG: creatininase family protein, partial [Gemmatimonadetes bacterium]|nr:creatininase family protein [Gemmatimonadota bacterium]NIU79263.1 creatininase family protein [Gammaproteobacteria bacterium]NIV90316.1 creatininase family protein [Actinomycetota bacterium]NIQ59052.1 creatininase family protein [Gemmatimonadota bacterium]NIX47948.1 creatininase family protein [Gemmatimonadota bacterium]
MDADTIRDLVTQIATSLKGQDITTLAIANAHLDPAHLASLRDAAAGAPAGMR